MKQRPFLSTLFTASMSLASIFANGLYASPVIDNVNGNAKPPFLAWGGDNAGWVYTPSFSYSLDGIYSTFENVGSATQQGPVATRTVILSVFDKTPTGSLLARTTFTADGRGGNLGGSFPAILLLAGHDYFIGYEHIYNIGLNIPNWMPNQAPGTVNLNGWYIESNWGKYLPKFIDGVLQVFSAPILRFEGAQVAVLPAADCLFNWAEKNYPQLFSPATPTSQAISTYYYRYYKDSKAYVGISTANNHVYYLGEKGPLEDAGDLTGWLAKASCS
jgi:hypothetical protein